MTGEFQCVILHQGADMYESGTILLPNILHIKHIEGLAFQEARMISLESDSLRATIIEFKTPSISLESDSLHATIIEFKTPSISLSLSQGNKECLMLLQNMRITEMTTILYRWCFCRHISHIQYTSPPIYT